MSSAIIVFYPKEQGGRVRELPVSGLQFIQIYAASTEDEILDEELRNRRSHVLVQYKSWSGKNTVISHKCLLFGKFV